MSQSTKDFSDTLPITEDREAIDRHYELFDAASYGDLQKVKAMAPYVTPHDIAYAIATSRKNGHKEIEDYLMTWIHDEIPII